MATFIFGDAITLLKDLKFYDVVLPFIFIFTITFAILERTKIFGTYKIGDEEVPKKNLNAIVAMCIAFFFIASAKLVEMVSVIASWMMILVVIILMYLIGIGLVYSPGEEFKVPKGIKYSFIVIGAIVIAVIFFRLIGIGNVGEWFKRSFFTSQVMGIIILLSIIIITIALIVKEPSKK